LISITKYSAQNVNVSMRLKRVSRDADAESQGLEWIMLNVFAARAC